MKDPYKKYLGKSVKYYDYLDTERFGRIVAVEQNPNDLEAPYIYIEDEESEYNIHQDTVGGTNIVYAELRLSTEIYLIE